MRFERDHPLASRAILVLVAIAVGVVAAWVAMLLVGDDAELYIAAPAPTVQRVREAASVEPADPAEPSGPAESPPRTTPQGEAADSPSASQ